MKLPTVNQRHGDRNHRESATRSRQIAATSIRIPATPRDPTSDHTPYVFEAVATVRFTPLDRWIARGAGQHFVVKRLRNARTVLDANGINRLRTAAMRFAGRPYDLTFEWSDDRMYCSELVWKAHDRGLGIDIGALQHLSNFNLTDPAVQVKMRERYGDSVPLNEPVISPVAMLQSTLLTTVAEQ